MELDSTMEDAIGAIYTADYAEGRNPAIPAKLGGGSGRTYRWVSAVEPRTRQLHSYYTLHDITTVTNHSRLWSGRKTSTGELLFCAQ